MKIYIEGQPPTVTAQMKGARCVPHAGGMIPRFYKTKNYKAAEQHYLSQMPQGVPARGPVGVRIRMSYAWRASEPKKNRAQGAMPKVTRPDVDNSVKIILDCLTKKCYWGDDAQVTELTAVKEFADTPGVEIHIWSIDGQN